MDYQKHSTDMSYVCKHIEAVFRVLLEKDADEVRVVRRYVQDNKGFRRMYDMYDKEVEDVDKEETNTL
jgi:hypothetical protein